MALSDIAEGLTVTTCQRERGVATVDDTGVDLVSRLSTHEADLPCTAEAAATVVDGYAAGTSIGDCAAEAAVAPITAAKVLHRCGVSGVSPLTPETRPIVRDWLDGLLSRTDALALTGVTEAEFALGVYVETHEAIPELATAADASLSPSGNPTVQKRNALAETMSDPGALR